MRLTSQEQQVVTEAVVRVLEGRAEKNLRKEIAEAIDAESNYRRRHWAESHPGEELSEWENGFWRGLVAAANIAERGYA